ncbi:flagellar filament capping protein FliD [Azohydromonas sediminis]|uniref:flagellar filament capping protein FliD n=1 Tax=Azohydromonas sediminis TaxID=2259674 RepID=UPI000E649E41|nr:flagellar filament capping protein FliD [Azohydromonas sediminis]
MATISSPGIGSGLDVQSIVAQLVALERRPIQQLEKAATKIQTQISAFGKLQSALSTLRDAAARLTRSDTWGAVKAASSRPEAVAASAAPGAQTGSYSVLVQQLAAGQTVASSAFADRTALVGAGTLRIELGDWDAAPPVPKTGATAVDIAVTADDTLETLRNKINAADAGVAASIVSDVNGARLVLRSRETGAENGFRIQVSGDADGNDADDAGLSALAFDPSGGTSFLTRSKQAADALVQIDGIAVQSKTNQLGDVIGGLSLTLTQAGPDPVEITVAQDDESLRKSVNDFVTAYNEAIRLLREQTKYDPASKTAGPLQGDRTGIALMSQLRALMAGSSSASSVFTRLAEIGLDVQTDGTIQVRGSKLDNAVAHSAELRKLFAATGTDPDAQGFAQRFKGFLDQVLGADGTLPSRTSGLQTRLKSNELQKERLEQRIALTEQRLLRQYNALDTRLGQLSGLSQYMTQQITQFNKTSK